MAIANASHNYSVDMFLPANDPSHWDQYTVDELQDLFTHVWYHQDRVIQGSCCELGLC